MSEPFDFRTWLRRHPFTVLLLVVTVIVNVLIIGQIQSFDLGKVYLLFGIVFGIVLGQITLLSWWVAAPCRLRWLRFIILVGVVGLSTFMLSAPDFDFVEKTFLGLMFISTVVSCGAWNGWRIFRHGPDPPPRRFQFSMRQLLVGMTVCALVTILATKVLTDTSELGFFVGTISLGIVGPGLVLFTRWPIYVRWMLPLFAGQAIGAVTVLAFGRPFDLNETAFLYGVCTAIYSLWGLVIGIDAQRSAVTNITPED